VNGPIVVGTDGSDTATAAVEEAIQLFAALKQPLHVVSAYKPLPAGGGEGIPPEFSIRSDSAVQGILDDAAARARVRGVKANVHARKGDPAEAILDIAEEIGASVIIVGNKGIGSLKRFVLGNVPSKIVHNSPCSTYVVRTT
jgi:nucleotide-binding universal stress UspA family protein